MSNKLNVVLIFGGKSGEHDVSLLSARSVLNAIDHEKYQVFQVGITREGRWTYAENTLIAFEDELTDLLNDALILSKGESACLYEVIDGQLQEAAVIDVVFPN